jgi:hypothetical protein
MDRRTKRIWLASEGLGLIGMVAVSLFLDMRVYGHVIVIVIAVLIAGLTALALWKAGSFE